MHGRTLAALLMAAVMGAACGPSSVDASGDPACEVEVAGVETGICAEAIAVANARLGLHWPIASTSFRTSICPPNARCLAHLPGEGVVIFTFWIGDPVLVDVQSEPQPDGAGLVLVAGDPQPLPDWLLEELQHANT